MSRKRKTREQKIHAQEKKLKTAVLPQDNSHTPLTYSVQIEPIQSDTKTLTRQVTATVPLYVRQDLTKSIITALTILCASALVSFVIKQTDLFSLIGL